MSAVRTFIAEGISGGSEEVVFGKVRHEKTHKEVINIFFLSLIPFHSLFVTHCLPLLPRGCLNENLADGGEYVLGEQVKNREKGDREKKSERARKEN